MNAVEAVFGATMLAQTVRMAIPYACAAVGGVWSERSGVVNIALEGILLAGAFAAVAAHLATGSAWVGLLAGCVAGAALAGAHAVVVVFGRANAIVSGIAINLAAAGGTRFLLRWLFASSSNSPPVDAFRVPLFAGTTGAAFLSRALTDPLTLLTAALVAWTAWTLRSTRFGLRVRACGEDPAAAASVGIRVSAVRVAAVTLGGAVAGLGGVALAYDEHQFQSGMSGGRGFIALAAVILAGWRPVRAAAACLAFAVLDALQVVIQGRAAGTGGYLAQMLPYVATLVALGVIAGRRRAGAVEGRPPAALGQP